MGAFSSSDNIVRPQTVPEITPSELIHALEADEPLQILDIRARRGQAASSAGSLPEKKVLNIVGSELLRYSSLASANIDPATPIVVMCAHGNDSKIAAAYLNHLGARARSLKGGMAAWMMLSVPRVLPAPQSSDRLVQFDRVGKESLSYLLISSGEAMIIDPPRALDIHLQAIEEAGAKLTAVADTHAHADYISGAPRIAHERGIPYFLHPADSVYPYDDTPGTLEIHPVADGMTIHIGRCTVVAHHTPGHSPGSVTYLIEGDAAFTGDFLFVTSIGRPDLADKTEEWSAHLWRSIQTVKRTWPQNLMIYPAHYTAGTPRLPGGGIGDSFGHLVRSNPSLAFTDESGFQQWISDNATAAPAAYRTIKGINVGLIAVDDWEAETLEYGKNECAIGNR